MYHNGQQNYDQWSSYYDQYEHQHNQNYYDRDAGECDSYASHPPSHNRANIPNQNFRGRGRAGRGQRGQRGHHHHHHPFQANGPGGHKPWMTDELLKAMKERNDLQRKAQESGNPDDWSIFKAVRNRTSLLLSDAKRIYESEQKNAQVGQPAKGGGRSTAFYCDTCDRSFPNQTVLSEHNAEHVTCKLDGCEFTAHPKVILKHIEMQHSNNLFSRVKGYDSPEDIERWKADRRAKYPTAVNLQKKEEEIQERIQRGERLPIRNGNKFRRKEGHMDDRKRGGHGARGQFSRGSRGRSGQGNPRKIGSNNECPKSGEEPVIKRPHRQPFSFGEEKPVSTSSGVDRGNSIVVLESFYAQLKVGENGSLVGRKLVAWDGEMQRLVQKTARSGQQVKIGSMTDDTDVSEESEGEVVGSDAITDEDDEEMIPLQKGAVLPDEIEKIDSAFQKLTDPEPLPPTVTVTGRSSGLVLVDYSSDSDSEDEPPTEIPIDMKKEDGEIIDNDDDSPPIEPRPCSPSRSENVNTITSQASVQTSMTENGSQGFGLKNPRKKFRTEQFSKPTGWAPERTIKKRRQPRMPKLLRKLLENDIRRERNQILQVCRFIVENNFFDSSSTAVPSQLVSMGEDSVEADCASSVKAENQVRDEDLPSSVATSLEEAA